MEEHWLEQAQDDATLLAIRDMERAGINTVAFGKLQALSKGTELVRQEIG